MKEKRDVIASLRYKFTPEIMDIFYEKKPLTTYIVEREGNVIGKTPKKYPKAFREYFERFGFTFTPVRKEILVSKDTVCGVELLELIRIVDSESGDTVELTIRIPSPDHATYRERTGVIVDHIKKTAGQDPLYDGTLTSEVCHI